MKKTKKTLSKKQNLNSKFLFHSLQSLDWNELLSFIEKKASSHLGKNKIRNLKAFQTPKEAMNYCKKIELIKELLLLNSYETQDHEHQEHFGVKTLSMKSLDTYSLWKERLNKTSCLTVNDLQKLRNFLKECKNLKTFLQTSEDSEFKEIQSNIFNFTQALLRIDEFMTEEGEIQVTGSHLLHSLYIEKNEKIKEIQSLLNQFVKNHNIKSLLQDRFVTTREGRWVLPIKSGMRQHFNGIIHATSQSQKTVFIEPDVVLQINNKVQETSKAIEDEVSRLLTSLSEFLYTLKDNFEKSKEILLEFDLLLAHGKSSLELKTSTFEFKDIFKFTDLKHPLLVLKSNSKDASKGECKDEFKNEPKDALQDEVIPNDLNLNKDNRVLLLSGVNTGGKTVFLKAIGLASQMARCGLPICAKKKSFIPFFKYIHVVINDSQSIEEHISRFAFHLESLNQCTQVSGFDNLILIDEICSSTDPEEGGALAKSFIQTYSLQNVYAVITSHLRELQESFQMNKGVTLGSFEFYPEEGPTYKFLPGGSGHSFAIKIAERMGIEPKIIERAKAFLDPKKRASLDRLNEAENDYKEIKNLKTIWKKEIEKARKKQEDYELLEKEFVKEKEKRLLKIFKEVEETLKSRLDLIEKEDNLKRKEKLQALKASLPDIIKIPKNPRCPHPPQSIQEFKTTFPPGSLVYVPSLREKAIIQALPNKKGEVTVLYQSMRLTLPWNELQKPPESLLKEESPLSKFASLSKPFLYSSKSAQSIPCKENQRERTPNAHFNSNPHSKINAKANSNPNLNLNPNPDSNSRTSLGLKFNLKANSFIKNKKKIQTQKRSEERKTPQRSELIKLLKKKKFIERN